jgi:hypothetical protein
MDHFKVQPRFFFLKRPDGSAIDALSDVLVAGVVQSKREANTLPHSVIVTAFRMRLHGALQELE